MWNSSFTAQLAQLCRFGITQLVSSSASRLELAREFQESARGIYALTTFTHVHYHSGPLVLMLVLLPDQLSDIVAW